MYEIQQIHVWEEGSDDLSDQWHFLGDKTFYKSSVLEPVITQFSYPVTISVTVSGNPTQEQLTITSRAESGYGIPEKTYLTHLESEVVRSLFGTMHIIEVKEN